jgi:HTH-type transcriptional regulator / antitoxin HipB
MGGGVRIDSPRDLGFYVRERRRELGKTQTALAAEAGVSRRWLSDLEGGKPTAEIGLVLRALHALRLDLVAEPIEPPSGTFDLEDILADLRKPRD